MSTVDVAGLTSAGRALAEQLMADTGTVTRPAAGRVLDEITGDSTPAAPTVVHSGPCRVRTPGLDQQVVVFGDVQVTRLRLVVNFPATIPTVMIGDVVRIAGSNDPHIGDRSFRVVSVVSRSVLMYRQLGLEVIE